MHTFVMKKYKGETIHGMYSTKELKITGMIRCQGLQAIDDVPDWVVELLDIYPDVQQIALSGKTKSAVWSRKRARRNNMPTVEEVERADREQICRWYRFLPSPVTEDEVIVMNRLCHKFNELGGFTPALSKKIGWD